jgi:excisionase family DNA binding protein
MKEISKPLTVPEVSKALGLSPATIRAWIAARRISYIRLGRSIRILPSEIQKLLENGSVPARRRD